MNPPSTRAVEHLIVLRVLVDDGSEWWEALGLPDPSRWSLSDTFTKSVLPAIEVEEVVQR